MTKSHVVTGEQKLNTEDARMRNTGRRRFKGVLMGFDIQKASVLKRISAGILDFILLIVLSVGCAVIVSLICDFDGHIKNYENYLSKYQNEYNIDFSFVGSDEYNALSEEEQSAYKEQCEKAYQALIADTLAMKEYNLVMSLTIVITSIGIFLSFMILEFILPLILKNGQTIGKKVFGIAVMHTNCVKIRSVALFIRSILGKYVIETMIPVLILIMMYFNVIGIVSIIVLAGILILEIVVYFVSKNRSLIHDILAKTVAVDLASQMIYSTEEEALETMRLAKYEESTEYVPGTFSFGKTVDGREIIKNSDSAVSIENQDNVEDANDNTVEQKSVYEHTERTIQSNDDYKEYGQECSETQSNADAP